MSTKGSDISHEAARTGDATGESSPTKTDRDEDSPAKKEDGQRVHRARFGSVLAVTDSIPNVNEGGEGGGSSFADVADKANAKAAGVAKTVAIFKTYAEDNMLRRKSSVEGMASLA